MIKHLSAALLLLVVLFSFQNCTKLSSSEGTASESSTTGTVVPPGSISKTANYAVVDADSNKIFALSGGFNTLSFASPASYGANFTVTAINGDFNPASWRGKKITVQGQNPVILWPGQTAAVSIINGAWLVSREARWKQRAFIRLYVDVQNGSDENDGLAPGAGNAFKTLFHAVTQVIHDQFDLMSGLPSGSVSVQLADGIYPDGVHVAGAFTGSDGNLNVLIQGNAANPSATEIKVIGQNHGCIETFNNALINIQDVKLSSDLWGVMAQTDSKVRLKGGVIFGDAGSVHMIAMDGGHIFVDLNYSIAGSAPYHVVTQDGGQLEIHTGVSATFTSPVTFSSFFTYAARVSDQYWAAITFNKAAGASVSGPTPRWSADATSSINANGRNLDTLFAF